MDCIFCKIVNNEAPSYTIFEDEIVKVFMNINPASNGHLLIVPKKHYTNLVDIPLDTLNHINMISKNMYTLLKEKLHVDGLTISQNNDYGQEVKDFHMHLTPRYKGEKVDIVYNGDKLDVKEVFNILTR